MSMTKAAETIQRIQYIKEHTTALEGLWTVLISDTLPSQRQSALWLNDYDYEAITQALKVTAKWLEKQDDPDEIEAKRVVAYVGTCLRNAKILKMSPDDRAQEISNIRATAGRLGALKKWNNERNEAVKSLAEFARVSQKLPSVCHNVPAVAVDVDFDVDGDRGLGRGVDGGIEGGASTPIASLSKSTPISKSKKRPNCKTPKCPAKACPSGTGYCSGCDSKRTPANSTPATKPEPMPEPEPKPAAKRLLDWDDYCDNGLCLKAECTCKPREGSAEEKAAGAFKGMEL